MYTYEQRMEAIRLYYSLDHKLSEVITILGYPDKATLSRWIKRFEEEGDLPREKVKWQKYSQEEKDKAVRYFLENRDHMSLNKAVKNLGYGSRPLLQQGVKEADPSIIPCRKHSPHVILTKEQKRQAVLTVVTWEDTNENVARTLKVTPSSVTYWKKDMLGKDWMNLPKDKLNAGFATIEELMREKEELQASLDKLRIEHKKMKLEYDLLEKAAEIIKKGQGISLENLTNREKALVIDALKGRYRLEDMIKAVGIARSTYFAQEKAIKASDKYSEDREMIKNLFVHNYSCYGYRRIHACLKAIGRTLSEKIVRRIMKEEHLVVASYKKPKPYSSYVGEVTPPVKNLIKRDFHAKKPNEKWLTDITEFHIPAGKVYLSPIIDCFDGMPVAWTIGTSPSSELANTMLDKAMLTLRPGEKPIVHSDRGGHYRWNGWISRMESNGLIRSMSKKACSPDNSACEGFFGRIKNEIFYGRDWQGWSLDDFMYFLSRYLNWFCYERIKLGFNGKSPMTRRFELGLTS